MTLGKSLATGRILGRLGLEGIVSEKGASVLSLLESVRDNRDDYVKLVAYHTLPCDECLDLGKVERGERELRDMEDYEVATLVSVILKSEKVAEVREHFRFDDEKKRLERVGKVKKGNGNNVLFGGRSIWGSLVDFAAQRYGWTLHYILWEISYANLSLLIEDHTRSVYLTDEEMRKANLPKDNIYIQAGDSPALEDFISTQDKNYWK